MKYMYYALVLDVSMKEYFIIKSQNIYLIQDKIKSIVEFPFRHHSSCSFVAKSKIDRDQRRYYWASGGEISLKLTGRKYEIYFHKCKHKIKKIPAFEHEGHDIAVKDVIKNSLSITYIQEEEKNLHVSHMLKKCQVKLLHISSGTQISQVKI